MESLARLRGRQNVRHPGHHGDQVLKRARLSLQHHDGWIETRKILSVWDTPIGCEKHIELMLRELEKVTVLLSEFQPRSRTVRASVPSGNNRPRRRSGISSSRTRKVGVSERHVKIGRGLLAAGTWEAFQEIVQSGARLQIIFR